jgi:hypothetical protein
MPMPAMLVQRIWSTISRNKSLQLPLNSQSMPNSWPVDV